jgi:hypothetical protein
MSLEQGRPQQFFMPDKGTGRPGGRKKEEKELRQAIQEFRKGTPSNILSTEPKISPSTRARLTEPHSEEIKQVLKDIEGE